MIRVLLALSLMVGIEASASVSYENEVQPFLRRFCVECHGGEKVKGKVDFLKMRTDADRAAAFETWEAAIELMREGEMPPDAARQPSAADLEKVYAWYQERFVDSVTAHPGYLRPRRLSAREFRNTLRDLFGFDLETAVVEAEQTVAEKSLVMKLLPTDPPGKSGFQNDTHGNPLTPVIWDQYSYLIDTALDRLFSDKRREQLTELSGPIPTNGFTTENAGSLLEVLLPRIFRRPAPPEKIQAVREKLAGALEPKAAARSELKAALMSPGFLYRGLMVTGEKDVQISVDEFELAERLSYFLWGSPPDSRLAALAGEGSLAGAINREVARMLASPKAMDFVEDFAVQWLALDAIDELARQQVPLAIALKSQPVEFLHHLIVEDRPLLELIDSRTDFANSLTAKFYGPDGKRIPSRRGRKGIELEAVPLTKITLGETPERGGLLTMPGILAMNRGPVQRGNWMLERILGVHLPEPPPDVGQVEPNRRGEKLSFRQRFERHRSNPTCAVCHDRIDPLGFALQAYDDKGAFTRAGDIDTAGQLPDGEKFEDFAGLKRILVTSQKEPIIRNLVKRLMSYALCRKLEIHDQPTVERITRAMIEKDGTWRDLILEVVNSLPFRETVIKGANS